MYYWTDKEQKILIKNFDKMPILKLSKLLPNRTFNAVVAKCGELGLRKYLVHQAWTKKEDGLVKKHYKRISARELQYYLPERTLEDIYRRANTLNILKRNHAHKFKKGK